jgi:transcriptional regulator with GAF, ATPase, and Fis domain
MARFWQLRERGEKMDSLKTKIKEIEREEIVKALKECNWIMARAARKLGITERMIGYKIKKYGIRVKEVRWIEDVHEQNFGGENESNQK